MTRRLDEIEDRIGEVQEMEMFELKREQRINEIAAGIYAKQEKDGVAGLGKMLEKAGLKPTDIEQFFAVQSRAAGKMVKMATSQLQLSDQELTAIVRQERAILLIDPCLWVHNSPGWQCAHYASSCDSSQTITADASASCTCDLGKKEINPKVKAEGQGLMGLRWANLDCWCNFDIPARPTHATVTVYTMVAVHGFYVVNSGPQWARFTLDLEMTGYQYGVAWATDKVTVLDVTGNSMGRFDSNRSLQFVMPVGADPFQVRVTAKLRARAKGGGSVALGDFATGNGNYMKVFWVNTYSP